MREKLGVVGWKKSRKKNLSQGKRVHMNEYKSQDYKVMYYAFKPMPSILGTKLEVLALTTILSDKLIISIMSVFSCQPEWKLLGLGMGTTFF